MLTLTNLRRVTKSDESGERDAIVGDFCLDGDELTIADTADLAISTRPGAEDARLHSRPLCAAVQGVPS